MKRFRWLASAALLLGLAAGAAAQGLFENVPIASPAAPPSPPGSRAQPSSNCPRSSGNHRRPGRACSSPATLPKPASTVPATAAAPVTQAPPETTPAPATRAAATAPAATRAGMKPEEAWDILFAKEAAAVAKAPKHDSAVLAAKILAAAKEVPGDPPVQAYLCTKAFEFGTVSSEGYATASAAMELMGQQPKLKSAADEKLLSLYDLMWKAAYGDRRRVVATAYVERAEDAAETQMQLGKPDAALLILRNATSAAEFLTGDAKIAFQLRLKEALHKSALAKRATDLKTTVQMGVSRAKFALELVELLLVDMDTPADAVTYAPMTNDESIVRRVELAAKKPTDLGEPELLELAAWYEKKLETANDYAQYQTLPHALALLQQYMEVHDAEDVLRLKAKLSWEKMQTAYQKAAAAVAPRNVVDLIALVNPPRHGIIGTWKITGGHLIGTMTDSPATVLLPYQPPAEYDLRVDFRRVEGNDAIVLSAMQNGKRFAWMIAAYGNTICAIETPDGGKPKKNAAIYQPVGGVIKNGTDHTVVLKVRKGGIALTLDGILIGQHVSDGSDLGAVRPHWNPISPLGIILHAKQYDISRLELTEVTGTGKKWDMPAVTPPVRAPRGGG